RAATELVYLVEPHNLSFIVVDQKHECSRKLNDGIIMLELVAYSIPSWFSEVQLCLKASTFQNQEDDRDDLAEGADSALRRTISLKWSYPYLDVVRIKAYSRYGYDHLSEIVLRRADFHEHTIAEKDFKNMHPSDFEDLNLLLLQGHLDHLPGYEFKHDYTIIEFPRAFMFLVNNNKRKIMRFNEIYKFSGGTLTRILEAMAYRVKEFKIKRLNL
nr:hypothetical protein CTI12_AA475510 [Tanacetum cinerariifolium]